MAPEMMIVKNNPPSNWDIDSGYDTMADPANDYPLRSFNTKNQAALIVYLQLLEKDLDLEHLCRRFGKEEGTRHSCKRPRSNGLSV